MTGIYAIKIKNAIVYVGKAKDVRVRINNHWQEILSDKPNKENKYKLLHSIVTIPDPDYRVHFVLLCELPANDDEALGVMEEKYIKALEPCLNSMFNKGRGKTISWDEFFNEIERREDWVRCAALD